MDWDCERWTDGKLPIPIGKEIRDLKHTHEHQEVDNLLTAHYSQCCLVEIIHSAFRLPAAALLSKLAEGK